MCSPATLRIRLATQGSRAAQDSPGSDLGTGAVGVLLGNIVAYSAIAAPRRPRRFDLYGKAIMVVMTIIFLTLTYLPPRFFIFEDFLGYEFRGE